MAARDGDSAEPGLVGIFTVCAVSSKGVFGCICCFAWGLLERFVEILPKVLCMVVVNSRQVDIPIARNSVGDVRAKFEVVENLTVAIFN